jgi:prepilin-type N-terminal cleavage/methylation domain-containing protein
MKQSRLRRSGFTLIELLMVVAIIGLLSAMAIPASQGLVWRSKRSERTTAMKNIQQSMKDYLLANDGLVNSAVAQTFLATWNPPLPVTGQRRPFSPGTAGWIQLVWQPTGYLGYSYYISGSFSSTSSYFLIYAVGDADANNKLSQKVDRYDLVSGIWQLTSETESGDPW